MIRMIKEGKYKLLETKKQTKILILDKKELFAWINVKNIGELLVSSYKEHSIDCILALGRYRLYNVKDEKKLIDTHHLELCVGSGVWQGYLLPLGLPDEKSTRRRIIPTTEVITKPSRYSSTSSSSKAFTSGMEIT